MKLVNICNNCQILIDNATDTVFSYGTPVLAINRVYAGGNVHYVRLWDDWSVTTQRHINKALDYYGMDHINKKTWDAMEVEPA